MTHLVFDSSDTVAEVCALPRAV